MKKKYYMEEALKEARKALEKNEVPIGAVIVCNGEIIGKGHNSRENENSVVGHAEIKAIEQACKNLGSWKLDGCSIFVTIEPCPMCAGAIMQSRITNVYYGAGDEKSGAFGSVFDLTTIQGFAHYPHVRKQIMEKECSELMHSFFKNIRAKQQKN
ncbi:MAG TPA: nucleoside deaminase [Erysipelotrichaceae bacterium]|jgi:tRNA(adenine34) deaminase|nr:nucleoside deaminase [Erysipelotrichia bacterium]HPX31890.1 nucleoside deaminase [Erysipelotrichaceae bacterium]HQA84402.1 nucleoside deaminase [Erysipelotrichaceae bacterium]